MSIRRQCALLGVNRSSVYYTPREERAENLALMRRMDELSLQYPFYGSRQMARHLGARGRVGGTAPGPPADASDGAGSALPQAAYEQPRSRVTASIRICFES